MPGTPYFPVYTDCHPPVIDVGCAALIRDGKVKVKQGCEIARLTEKNVIFSDGTSLEVDSIILA